MHRRASFQQLPLFLHSFPSHYSSCPTFLRSLQQLPKCFSLTITQSVWAKPGFWSQAEENKFRSCTGRSCLSLCRFGWTNTAIARRPKHPVLLLKKSMAECCCQLAGRRPPRCIEGNTQKGLWWLDSSGHAPLSAFMSGTFR